MQQKNPTVMDACYICLCLYITPVFLLCQSLNYNNADVYMTRQLSLMNTPTIKMLCYVGAGREGLDCLDFFMFIS